MTGDSQHKIAIVGVGTVANLALGRVAWIGRDLEESRRVCREIIDQHPGHPLAAVQSRWVVDVTAEDITAATDDPWAPTVDRFVVCGLPDGHPDWEHFAVSVSRHVGGVWTVRSRTYQISAVGDAHVVSMNDDWAPYLMPVGQALDVATARAKTITLRGRTAEQILEREVADV